MQSSTDLVCHLPHASRSGLASKGSLLGLSPQEMRNVMYSGDAGMLSALPNWVSRPSLMIMCMMLGSCVNSVLYIPIEGDKSARRTVSSGIFIPGRSVRM